MPDKDVTTIKDLIYYQYAKIIARRAFTAEDLMSEGFRMDHCVGGYAKTVKRGDRVIFHLEAAGEPSTIEISKHTINGTADHLFINQHKGVRNEEPSRFHKRRARDLVNYLNMKQY